MKALVSATCKCDCSVKCVARSEYAVFKVIQYSQWKNNVANRNKVRVWVVACLATNND